MKTRYALAALTQLALRPGAPTLIADLAERGLIGDGGIFDSIYKPKS